MARIDGPHRLLQHRHASDGATNIYRCAEGGLNAEILAQRGRKHAVGSLIGVEIDEAIDVSQAKAAVAECFLHCPSLDFLRIHPGKFPHTSFADSDNNGVVTHLGSGTSRKPVALTSDQCAGSILELEEYGNMSAHICRLFN